MRLLFAISVASFCAVMWIALALARRIERDRRARRRTAQRGPATEFFEAGEYRTPRPILANQQVSSIRDRAAAVQPAVAPVPPPEPIAGPVRHLWPSPPRFGAQAPLSKGVAVQQSPPIIDSTLQHVAAQRPQPAGFRPPDRVPDRAFSNDLSRAASSQRKSPQPARSGTFRRVDLSHYNKQDMGDLTDPYTHITRPSGVRRAASNS